MRNHSPQSAVAVYFAAVLAPRSSGRRNARCKHRGEIYARLSGWVMLRKTTPPARCLMVKAAFENLKVDLWVHPGKVGFAQPTVCLFHDAANAGGQLLDALAELKLESLPAQRLLTFRICSRKSALHQLRLRLVPQREDLKIMRVGRDHDTAVIEMTVEGLKLLAQAFGSWLKGSEDFGVSPHHSSMKRKEFGKLDRESGEVWFWGPRYAGP